MLTQSQEHDVLSLLLPHQCGECILQFLYLKPYDSTSRFSHSIVMKDHSVLMTARARRNHTDTERRVHTERKQIIDISEEDYPSYSFIEFISAHVKTSISLTSSKTDMMIDEQTGLSVDHMFRWEWHIQCNPYWRSQRGRAIRAMCKVLSAWRLLRIQM